jgi:hypothetical protein
MRAVLIIESCFGNTSQIADAVGEGLRSRGVAVETISAESAPPSLNADLVLVGAPTHNMGLPNSASRSQAAQKGGDAPSSGVREWIDRVGSIDGPVIAFSTTTGGLLAGSAGKAIVKAFKRHKIHADRGPDFIVKGTPGPLGEGELARAREWGSTLQA